MMPIKKKLIFKNKILKNFYNAMNSTDLEAVKEYVSTLSKTELRILMNISLKESLALEYVILVYMKVQKFSESQDLTKYNLVDIYHKVRKYQNALIEKYKRS